MGKKTKNKKCIRYFYGPGVRELITQGLLSFFVFIVYEPLINTRKSRHRLRVNSLGRLCFLATRFNLRSVNFVFANATRKTRKFII